METRQNDLTVEESVRQVMQLLPMPVRHYLAQAKYSLVIKNLVGKYRLHLDKGTILEREILLLLIGVENPTRVAQALKDEAQIDEQTVSSIMQDINDQIFVPLREEIEKESKKPQLAQTPKIVAQVPSYAPPKQSPPPAPPQAPRPVASQQPIPQKPAHAIPPPRTQSPAMTAKFAAFEKKVAPLPPKFGVLRPQTPLTPRPLGINRLLEDHEEPHIEFHEKRVMPPAPPQTVEKQSIPPNLPGVLHHTPEPRPINVLQNPHLPPPVTPARFSSPSIHQTTEAVSQYVHPPTPLPREEKRLTPEPPVQPPTPPQFRRPYSSDDPYREPIDGEK